MKKQVSPEALNELRQDSWTDAQLNLNFLFLAVSSCIIATLGLLINSSAVIIGAMIVAPLMMPLRSLAFAALNADIIMLKQSLKTLGIGTFSAIGIAWLVGRVFSLPASEFGSEILARISPTLADLGVAIAAGAVSGFAKIRPKVSDAVAGTAIAVALMPPLCTVGITLSQGQWGQGGNAFLLYFTNFLGITFACLVVFVWGGYYQDSQNMRRALRWLIGMVGLLIVPLFLSLSILLRQKNLQATIKELLQSQTITVGQQVELIKLQVDWNPFPWSSKPSTVILTVRASEYVTPKQVSEIERFLKRKLEQPFEVIFRVSEFQEVRAEESANLPP